MTQEEQDAIDIAEIQAIKKELEDTLYKDLKTKFEEMGIGEVYKAGTNKGDLIKLALQKLEELKAAEAVVEETEAVVEEAEATEAVVVVDENVLKVEDAEADAEADEKLFDEDKKEIEALDPVHSTELEETEYEHSEEELREILSNIDACLIQPSPTHRLILLAKKEKIEAKLYAIIGQPEVETED